MKRWFSLLMVAAFALALCGCQTIPGLQAITEATTPPTESAASETTSAPTSDGKLDPGALLPAPTEPVTESEENAGGFDTDFAHASSILEMACEESGSYTVTFEDGYEYTSTYAYYLPRLTENTAGANRINQRIMDDFGDEVDEALEDIEEGIGTPLLEVNWFFDTWDSILTIVISETNDWGGVYYGVYYYDMQTGQTLTPQELLSRANIAEDQFLDGVRAAAEEAYIEQYAEMDDAFRQESGYYEILEYATSDELINFDMVQFYIDYGGNVVAFVPVASLAGAAYYYQMLYPTIARG